jgi:histidyl-tRNA synthetase
MAEIELILATTTTLGRLGFHGFEIRINERRILKAMAAYAGFAEADYDSIFITLDKMDKIGVDGVRQELIENGYPAASVDKYLALFQALEDKKEVSTGVAYLTETLGDYLSQDIADNLLEIAITVEAAKEADFALVFDPTLVRGMSYYTGTIFEIAIPEFGGSCGGGGRYDEMIGKFTGQSVPACGFSIGFERIILLLLEQGYEIPKRPAKVAYLVEKKYPAEKLAGVLQQAKEAREAGTQVLVVRMNKNKKFQKEQLQKEGYVEFVEFFNRD